MICPHCSRTIPEEKRYLMSRDPDGGYVWSAGPRKVAILVLLFLIVLSVLVAVAH